MMCIRSRVLRSIVAWLLLMLATSSNAAPGRFDIAFGSCLRQWKAQPVWDGILAADPGLFVYLGDNVYTDTGPYRFRDEPGRITEAYAELAGNPGFQRLRASVPILATWDDHDYGANNAGAEYPFKQESKQAFMDFFAIPQDSPLHRRDGIYRSETIDTPAGRVQVLLLDTRSFRSPLRYGATDEACPRSRIVADDSHGASMLGEAQWAWLHRQLRQPADLRVIASSIQVIPDSHCFEKWANFPRERQRLLDAITHAPGAPVILLSGDRHLGEISRIDLADGRPLYEVTASGLNSAGAGKGEKNRFRATDDNVRIDHFGLLRLRRHHPHPSLSVELRDVVGNVIQSIQIDTAAAR